MTLYTSIVIAFLWCASNTLQIVDAQTNQSIRVEFVPQGVIQGCCSQSFYNATSTELFNYVNATNAQVIQSAGLSIKNFAANEFSLVNTNQCVKRQLLRGNQVEDSPLPTSGLQRRTRTSTNQQSSTCSSCTHSSCSSYCSGCYMCASSRRHLERDLQLVTSTLSMAFAAVSSGIVPHFTNWLTTGPGFALANGCMGTPSQLAVYVSLV